MLLSVNGVPYYWREAGSGPLLLLLHGGAAHSGWFQWMMPRLSKRYRVIAPDLRGHGRSGHADNYGWDAYAEDMEALVGLLAGDAPYYLAGHCSGGYIGMLMAARGIRPPAALIGLELRLSFTAEEDAAMRAFGRRPRRFPNLEALGRSARAYARLLRLPPERGATLRQEVFRPEADGSWIGMPDRRVLAQEQFRTYELAPRVECPTLLIRGGESRQLGRTELLLMACRLPHGTFEELPGVSHYMMVESPNLTNAALERFLEQVEASGRAAPSSQGSLGAFGSAGG